MNQYSAINNKSPPWSVGNCSGKTWMKDLECLNNVSLSDIILPGSHDAGQTAAVQRTLKVIKQKV